MSSKEKEQVRSLFNKIFQFPKNVGTVVNFSNVTSVIIDREELKRTLSRLELGNQKVMIMIPADPQNMCFNQIYAAHMIVFGVGANNCDPYCEDANFYKGLGYTVDSIPPGEDNQNKCRCTRLDDPIVIDCCPR